MLVDGNEGEPAFSTDPLAQLEGLAYNCVWSWDPDTGSLFQALAPDVWEATRSPVEVLNAVRQSPGLLDPYRQDLSRAAERLAGYLAAPTAIAGVPRVAYFSAEFAIAACLPIYSGGLGVLAGDHLKAASDLGLPLVGVGLLYRYGYFRQVIDETGHQCEQYDRLDTDRVPVRPVLDPRGAPALISIPFPGRTVLARVWRVQVGRVPLYLLDTDLPENREDDRWITGHLYGGDQDTRIRQEIVLGIGGIRLLRAVLPPDQQPSVYHMNEGHSAFLTLELARERLADGRASSFEEALVQGAPGVAFTTHTPVAAGHDAFPSDLVEAYFDGYREQLGLDHAAFMAYGRQNQDAYAERFLTTVLALRGSSRRNGVSQLHGRVSKEMWGGVGVGLQDQRPAEPMGAITNGVHVATWVGPEIAGLLDEQIGDRWRRRSDDTSLWRDWREVGIAQLWASRTAQRARLLRRVDAMARAEGLGGLAEGIDPEQALVLGFARRFATYKRAGLLLNDPDRLVRLLGRDTDRPVVLVFAGKAHPRDEPGKGLVQRVVLAARDPRFRGHLIFLENYDVDIARDMVQGSDVWLNTPRRPQEASGTSGMKAVLNGGIHVSELDGWWDEAYQPSIGWALGEGLPNGLAGDEQDAAEAVQLMEILEREVAPLYFERDASGLPRGWLERVRASMETLSSYFSAQRMVREYATEVYVPAGRAAARRAQARLQAIGAGRD